MRNGAALAPLLPPAQTSAGAAAWSSGRASVYVTPLGVRGAAILDIAAERRCK
jgi:hypothetical protein